jgi:hypothetical protein
VETTVVSYYTARGRRNVTVSARQQATKKLWPKLASEFETYISILVRAEVSKGDSNEAALRLKAVAGFPVLDTDEAAQELALKILTGHGIPQEFPEDALHIAIAAVNGIEVLITWNFAHLNNPFTRKTVRQIVEASGYQCPEICSPDELLEGTQ